MINAANILLARKDVSFLSGLPAKPRDTSNSGSAFAPLPTGRAAKEEDGNLMPHSGEAFPSRKEEKAAVYSFLVNQEQWEKHLGVPNIFSLSFPLLLKCRSGGIDKLSSQLLRHSTICPEIDPRNAAWQKAIIRVIELRVDA